MYGIIMILSLLGGDTPPNNTQQKTINVDSLFAKNISELKSIVNDMFIAEMYRKKLEKNECKKVCDCN